MRGPAAPMPCRTRPAIIAVKVGAKMLTRHPAMNRTRPAWMAGLRPIRSESGPKSIWPRPSPTKRAVMTNWVSFGRGAPRSRPIAGSAGSIVSIASATSDIRRAMRGTNSPRRRAGPSAVRLMRSPRWPMRSVLASARSEPGSTRTGTGAGTGQGVQASPVAKRTARGFEIACYCGGFGRDRYFS